MSLLKKISHDLKIFFMPRLIGPVREGTAAVRRSREARVTPPFDPTEDLIRKARREMVAKMKAEQQKKN